MLLAATTDAFTIQLVPRAPSTTLFDSRRRQKIASRSKWIEGRGGMSEGIATLETAGLMKNDEGLEYVKLVHPSGASSEIYLFGGCVTSY